MNLKNISITNYVLAALLLVAAFFVVFTNNSNSNYRKELKELKKDNLELEDSIKVSNVRLANLRDMINYANKEYVELLKSKSKTKIIYETKIENFADPKRVSNDSVSRYISSKIHN